MSNREVFSDSTPRLPATALKNFKYLWLVNWHGVFRALETHWGLS